MFNFYNKHEVAVIIICLGVFFGAVKLLTDEVESRTLNCQQKGGVYFKGYCLDQKIFIK